MSHVAIGFRRRVRCLLGGKKNALIVTVAICLLSIGFTAGGCFGIIPQAHAAEPILDRVQTLIKTRLEGDPAIAALSCQGEMICGIQMLPLAYRHTKYRPLWIDASLGLEKADVLAESIHRATEDGLKPRDYHLDAIVDLMAEVCEHSSAAGQTSVSPALWADLDLLLTDAFLLYGSHLAAGRVDPETLHTDWKVNPGDVDLLAALTQAAATGDIDAALERLRPAHSGYATLRTALARLRGQAAAKGWPVLNDEKTLAPGDRSLVVDDLRRRLTASGDLVSTGPDGGWLYFDATLASAVKRFQQRNGLKVDGIVGRDTVDMLTVPIHQRIRQVVLNLERWRWLPHDLGTRYIIVNTADFNLNAVKNGQVNLQMRVVVGRPARRSPVFSATMTHLVINPYWNVPRTIAVEDILPEIQKDVTYLAQQGIHVFRNWDVDAPEIDPATVDWQIYHADRFPFRLRQDPGPYNALGRIKFMFPNAFAVYLHDTPNHTQFSRVQRDLSSGCIRVESPVSLANFVLAGDERWALDTLTEAIEKGETRTIHLHHKIPVHLLYMTAWTDETGTLHFRRDIYGRDRDLAWALNQRRPDKLPVFIHRP